MLGYFIEHIPPTVHLVILTRADPILPIAKLRSQHQLVELRAADLSFSANDIHFLFNRTLKLKLSLADVQSLSYKTEGWIAGLQLIALACIQVGNEDASTKISCDLGTACLFCEPVNEFLLAFQQNCSRFQEYIPTDERIRGSPVRRRPFGE